MPSTACCFSLACWFPFCPAAFRSAFRLCLVRPSLLAPRENTVELTHEQHACRLVSGRQPATSSQRLAASQPFAAVTRSDGVCDRDWYYEQQVPLGCIRDYKTKCGPSLYVIVSAGMIRASGELAVRGDWDGAGAGAGGRTRSRDRRRSRSGGYSPPATAATTATATGTVTTTATVPVTAA